MLPGVADAAVATVAAAAVAGGPPRARVEAARLVQALLQRAQRAVVAAVQLQRARVARF